VNANQEVIVVGGGVLGCAVAFELAKRSAKVLLLDSSLPGRATSASAGGLWPVGEAVGLGCGVIYHAAQEQDADAGSAPEALPDLFRDFLLASNARFPALADDLRDRTGIDIELTAGIGLLFLMYTLQEQAIVDNIIRSLPRDNVLELLTPEELLDLEPRITPDLIGAALLPGEHQVNPMLLAEAYKRAAINEGAEFRHDTRVTGFRLRGNRVVGVDVGDIHLASDVTINAAGCWSGKLAASAGIELPVFPVRGQIVLTESLPTVLRGCVSTSECYLTQKLHGEVLIGSTTELAGFDVSVTQESITSLCRGAVRAVPMLRDVGIKRVWSGLRPGTPDQLPILGVVDDVSGLINATGGFRTGIVAAPLMAELVAQVVAGEDLAFPIESFLASRFGKDVAVSS
jgi:hydrogen cyanide synthase HcnC